MRTSLFTGLAAGPLITVAACFLTTTPPDQSEGSFCDDWAKAICQVGNGMCNFDVATCTAHQTSACTTYVSSLAGNSRQYSQPNGKACIDALNGAYGGGTSSIPASTLVEVAGVCSKVLVGNRASGQSCTTDNDCTGDLVCAPYVQGGSFCASVTLKDAGDPCADPGDECQGDSYCASTMVPPVCVATPATGSTCSASVPCGSSDHCVGGACQPLAQTGDSCQSNDDCSTGYCDPYPPVQCTNGLTFARGSDDCNGILAGSAVAQQQGNNVQSDGGAND